MPAITIQLRTLLAAFIILACSAAQADDDAAARAKAADRYLASVPMQTMLDDMVRELSNQVDEEKRAAFKEELSGLLNATRLEQIAREAMINIFNAEELNALADFYGSRAGQSVLRKFGAYMGQIMPAIQQEIHEAIRTMQARQH